jgi:hypothetical protein
MPFSLPQLPSGFSSLLGVDEHLTVSIFDTSADVAVLFAFAALNVHDHASAIDVADLQAPELGAPHAGPVEGHQNGALEGSWHSIDELRDFFLTAGERRIGRIGTKVPRPSEQCRSAVSGRRGMALSV